MRRLLLLSTFVLCFTLPRVGAAQDTDVAEEAPAQEEAVGDDGGYEPDQRGAEDDEGTETTGGEDQATGDTDYEPDQRGAEDEDDGEGGAGGGGEAQAPSPSVETTSDRDYALEAGSDEAARRGLGFDLQLFLGGGLTGIEALGGNNLVQDDQGGVFGGSFGVSLGLGVGPLTIGPRVSFTIEPAFVLGAVGLDIQVALTSGAIAPTLRLGLSYAFMLGLVDPLPSQNAPQGFWSEIGIGVRAAVAGPFVLGGEIAGGWLALFRDPVDPCTAPCTEGGFDLDTGGSGNGLTLRLHVYGALSF